MNIENTAAQTEQEQTAPAQTEGTAETEAKPEAIPNTSEPKPAESEAKPEAPETKPADGEEKSADTKAAPESAFAKIFNCPLESRSLRKAGELFSFECGSVVSAHLKKERENRQSSSPIKPIT